VQLFPLDRINLQQKATPDFQIKRRFDFFGKMMFFRIKSIPVLRKMLKND
jgi:hypothetical protein